MGARAVIAIDEIVDRQVSAPRWFHSGQASPDFHIPELADFYTWTLHQQIPLTLTNYLHYAAAVPGSLPASEIDVSDQLPGDIDVFYQLTLSEEQHGLQLLVFTPQSRWMRDMQAPIEALTHGTLYEAAARLSQTAAQSAIPASTSPDAVAPRSDPRWWAERARGFRRQQESLPISTVAANLEATFSPPTFHTGSPMLQLAGIRLFADLDPAGVLHVAVQLDQAQPWLRRADGTVATHITVNGRPVHDT